MEKEWVKLNSMISEEDQAKQVRVLTRLYHENMLRINLWAVHRLCGLTKKIKYWENSPGRSLPVNLEYITIN